MKENPYFTDWPAVIIIVSCLALICVVLATSGCTNVIAPDKEKNQPITYELKEIKNLDSVQGLWFNVRPVQGECIGKDTAFLNKSEIQRMNVQRTLCTGVFTVSGMIEQSNIGADTNTHFYHTITHDSTTDTFCISRLNANKNRITIKYTRFLIRN